MATDPPSINVLLAMLNEVLEPLGERRAQVLSWIAHETKTQPIISFCWDRKSNVWKLGEPSPTDDGTIVFAMLEGDVDRSVVVFTFQALEADTGFKTQFFREVLYEVEGCQGPIHHDALFTQLQNHLADVDVRSQAAAVCRSVAEGLDESEKESIEELTSTADMLDAIVEAESGVEPESQANGQSEPAGAEA